MITQEQTIFNDHVVHVINQLSQLLTKEIYPREMKPHNRFGLNEDQEKQIRTKIIDLVGKIKS